MTSLCRVLPLSQIYCRQISTTQTLKSFWKQTRVRVVDNSTIGKAAMLEGKPPKTIHVYKKGHNGRPPAIIGDKILVAIKGVMKKAIVIGCVQRQKAMEPKFDSNNVVLIDDNGNPLGTRVLAPVPHVLRRKPELAKIIAISTKFV